MKEPKGKWRRAEEQLTREQRRKISEMLRDGYDVSAVMERFGLTHEEQVVRFYGDESIPKSSPLDKQSVSVGHFKTTVGDVYHSIKAKSGKRNWSMIDSSEYF